MAEEVKTLEELGEAIRALMVQLPIPVDVEIRTRYENQALQAISLSICIREEHND